MRQCTHYSKSLGNSQIHCKQFGEVSIHHCHGCIKFDRKSRGFGDTLKKTFSSVGVTSERVQKLIGKDCGCPGRADKLNEMFPYKKT